jgi:hypothetical protein
MIKHRIVPLIIGLGLLGSLPLQAASISLQPSQALLQPAQSFTVDVLISATDTPGDHPGLHKGSIVIDFDPLLFSYDSLSLGSGISLYQALTQGTAGSRATLSFGFYNAPDTGTVASLTFTTTGAAGSSGAFGVDDTSQTVGSFFSTVPTNQRFYPSFNGAEAQIVPLPSAAWFAVTAFGLLVPRLRRAKRTR